MNKNSYELPTQGSATPDRAIICARLEETRVSFHILIASLTEKEWDSKRTFAHWTVRELVVYIVDELTHTPGAIEHVRRGKSFLTLPSFLNGLIVPINLLLSKWSIRGQTRQTVLARYDLAHQALVAIIEGIHGHEWKCGAPCYGDGYKTILDLCDIPNRHLQEHTVQLSRA